MFHGNHSVSLQNRLPEFPARLHAGRREAAPRPAGQFTALVRQISRQKEAERPRGGRSALSCVPDYTRGNTALSTVFPAKAGLSAGFQRLRQKPADPWKTPLCNSPWAHSCFSSTHKRVSRSRRPGSSAGGQSGLSLPPRRMEPLGEGNRSLSVLPNFGGSNMLFWRFSTGRLDTASFPLYDETQILACISS